MTKFQDAVRRLKNIVKIDNVYDCARSVLLVLGLFGIGSTSIRKTDGVHSLHNTRCSYLVTGIAAFMSAVVFIEVAQIVFAIEDEELHDRVYMLIGYFTYTLTMFTIGAGYIMALVSCKRLDRVLQILYNIDSQLETVNIRVQYWHIPLQVTGLALPGVLHITYMVYTVVELESTWTILAYLLYAIPFELFYTWVILFLLIIQQRFVCLNKLLQQNATVTNIHIVGASHLHDNYVLRRISLARHVHEQLTEVVHLFSDSCRCVIVGVLVKLMLEIIQYALVEFKKELFLQSPFTLKLYIQLVVLILICQANKSERRVLSARLRHLCAFETNREVIQQVQQYIMYNAFSTTGLVDFQLTDMDNVLLLTIIDVIVSNILIIYSYYR